MKERFLIFMLMAFHIWLAASWAEEAVAAGISERERQEKECMEHLRIIGEAIEAYKADHQGELPNWLSELYPEYLKDAKILLCPADESGGTKLYSAAAKDPSLPCSYQYEFNPQQADVSGEDFAAEIPEDDTWRKRRTRQLRYFGGLVPVVRCFHHTGTGGPRPPATIDLNYRGEVYRSKREWEKNYTSQNAVLKSLRETIERDPGGWDQEIAPWKLYDYFSDVNRRGELRSILESQRTLLPAEVLKVVGKIYDQEKNTEQALRIYRQLVQSKPDDTESRLRFAQLLAAQNEYQEALVQCRQVIQSKPNERRAYTFLAQIYAAMDESQAQARLEKILTLEAKERKAESLEGLSDDLRHNYVLRLQQSLLPKETDLRSAVKDAQEALRERFDKPTASDLAADFIEALHKATKKSLQWETYTTSDGLSNNYVWSIAQDSIGYLWFATATGVSRYDGRTFTDLPMPNVKGRLRSVLIDTRGNLWIGGVHGSQGVIRYDGKSFTSLTPADGLAHQDVWCILEDSQGRIWFGTLGGGVSRYDGSAVENLTTHEGLAGNRVRSILEDREGNLWFCTDGGVSRYDDRGMGDSPHFTNFTKSDGLAGNDVTSIAQDDEGLLWFGTTEGVSQYDGKTFTTFTKKNGLADDNVSTMLKDSRGNLWFVIDHWQGEGVSWYDGETFHTFTQEDGLSNNRINCIYEDREGHLWFGHNSSGGISRFDPQSFTNLSVQDGLAGNYIGSLFEDSHGNIWIGTDGGVSRYDGRGVTMGDSPHFTNFTTADGLAGNYVDSIKEDNQGHLWFGTEKGVSRYDGKTFTTFTTQDGLVGNWISTISQDREGFLWFGAVRSGISRYDGDSFTNFTRADGLACDEIRCFLEDSQGHLWIGTWGGGVSLYDGETFTNYTGAEGLVDNGVWSMLEDSQGRIWIGTMAGVSQYEPPVGTDNTDGRSFKTVPELAGKFVGDMVEDRNGYIWFGLWEGGVVKYDGKAFATLTAMDGLASDEVYCILEDREGRLWFGTGGEGLSLHIPNRVPPIVHIQRVIADKAYENPAAIEIPAGVGHVEIAYHGVSFKTRPGQMQYIYKLERRGGVYPHTH